jgi:hypothetical protein
MSTQGSARPGSSSDRDIVTAPPSRRAPTSARSTWHTGPRPSGSRASAGRRGQRGLNYWTGAGGNHLVRVIAAHPVRGEARSRDPDDRRKVIIRLTSRGASACARAASSRASRR